MKNGKIMKIATPLKKKRVKEYQTIIRDVFICSKAELAPFATTFSFSPENFEQQKFGVLFGIIKIDDHSENSSYIVNLLTSIIKKEYFGKPHRSPEESFEASLRKANLALAELVRHGVTSWSGKINFAGGAIERNNLYFTCLGNASIFLIRGDKIAEISAELEEEKEAESHPLKTFSNTSSGKLEIGDKLVFTTDELMNIFSLEELRQNASHFSREEFPGFLEISLQANSELAGTIIIDLADSVEKKLAVVEIPAIEKKQQKKINLFAGTQNILKKETQNRKSENILREKALASRKTSRKNTFLNFLEKARIAFFSILHSTRRINLGIFFAKFSFWVKSSFLKIKPVLSSILLKLKNIKWKEKETLVKTAAGVIILAIAFYGIVIIIKNRNKQKKLTVETAVQVAEPAPTFQNLDDINIKNIETIEEISVFSQETSRLVLFNNFLFIVPEKNLSVLKVDPNSKNSEEIKANLAVGSFRLAAAMPHLRSLFLLTEDNKIVSFTPVNKNFQENNISLPENLKAADIKTYLTYLYILDPGANQIYRYPRAEGGFGEAQNWLRNGTDIKSAKNFAINDNLFAVSSSDITVYFQGKIDNKINFEKPKIPLSIEKIFSEPDMEGIYILDNKNRRIIKYGKDGKILNQYFNAEISSIEDFSVDEKNKVIYLLKGNQLLKFSTE
mgnify:CR=1 FL=1